MDNRVDERLVESRRPLGPLHPLDQIGHASAVTLVVVSCSRPFRATKTMLGSLTQNCPYVIGNC
jgi:hypothetical protein